MKLSGLFIVLAGALVCFAPAAHSESLTEYGGQHGVLTSCDDITQEQHLYLMNSEELGLDEEQVKRLRKIKGECDKECILDRAKLRVAKMELGEILEKDEIDMGKVQEKSGYISELMNNLRIRLIKAKVEAMMVLTDDQKKKAKRLDRKR